MGVGESVMGYNLYAYCNNNPVDYADYDGHMSTRTKETLKNIAIAAGVVAIGALCVAAIAGSGGAAAGPMALAFAGGGTLALEASAAGAITIANTVAVTATGVCAAAGAALAVGNGKDSGQGLDSAKVNYNGTESPVYRGGNDFTVKSNEIKINPKTGNVKTSHGVSVNVNPKPLSRFGGAYRIDSIPNGLKIIQRGMDLGHYEIVPAYEMPLNTFQQLLTQIKVVGPY